MTHEEKSEAVNTLIVNYLRLDDEAKEWFNNKINGWISVDDRVPRENENVLVCDQWETMHKTQNKDILVAYISKSLWQSDTVFVKITHWMPLPNFPKNG